MRRISIVLLMLPLSGALAAREEISFERYQSIIDRAPFGSLPAPTRPENASANPNQPPPPSFADTLRVSSIIEDPDTGLKRVGFVYDQSKESFFIVLGDTNNVPPDGIELLSVDYVKEEVLLQKGDERALVKLSSGKAQRVTGPQTAGGTGALPRPGPPVPGNPESYAVRRSRMHNLPPMEAPQNQSQTPQTNRYIGEDLQKHLSDYKMEAIRQGLPALPIPLTREEDDQLVREGVLPPQ